MTDPIVAARARVEALLARFTRIDLQVVVVDPPDAQRLAVRERARAAAAAAARSALFDEAVAAARETTFRAFARAGFSGTWAATEMSVSIANANDRVAAAAAFEEAAMAAVVEDLVDGDTLEELRQTWSVLDRSTGMPAPGSLSALVAPAAAVARGPLQVAMIGAIVTAGVALWIVFGLGAALLVTALGLSAMAGIGRRRNNPDS